MREQFRKLFLIILTLTFSFILAIPANAKVYSIEHDDETTQLKELHNQVQQNTNDINNLYSIVTPGNSAYNSYSGWCCGYGNICDNLAVVYNLYYSGAGNEMELLSIISYCRSYDYYDSSDNGCDDDENDCNDNHDDDEDDCDSDDDCDNEDDCDEEDCDDNNCYSRCRHRHHNNFWDDYWDNYWDENDNECRWGDDCYPHNNYTSNECWDAETYEEYLECRDNHYPHYRNDPPPRYFGYDGTIDYGEDAYKSWADLCQREQQGGYYSDWCNERRWWITGSVIN